MSEQIIGSNNDSENICDVAEIQNSYIPERSFVVYVLKDGKTTGKQFINIKDPSEAAALLESFSKNDSLVPVLEFVVRSNEPDAATKTYTLIEADTIHSEILTEDICNDDLIRGLVMQIIAYFPHKQLSCSIPPELVFEMNQYKTKAVTDLEPPVIHKYNTKDIMALLKDNNGEKTI